MGERALNPEGEPELTYRDGLLFEVWQEKFVRPNGEVKIHEIAKRPPGVRIIIPSEDGAKILMSDEHRSEQGGRDLRLPGGKVADSIKEYNQMLNETGKSPEELALEAVKAEGKQESGIVIKEAKLLGVDPCGSSVEWDLFIFVATDYEFHPEGQELEDGESIVPVWIDASPEIITRLVVDGSFNEGRSLPHLIRYVAGQHDS